MASSKEPSPSAEAACEHFIPVRKTDLVAFLGDSISPREREAWQNLCRLVESVFHHEFHERLETLKADYASFDPDSDTLPIRNFSTAERDSAVDDLFTNFKGVMDRANYRYLCRGEIDQLLEAAGKWGVRLEVDFELLDRFEVYVRGNDTVTTTRRRWQKRYALEEVTSEIYQRLVLVFRHRQHPRLPRTADTSKVFLKLFKDIPHQDLKILLPGVRVRMTLLDQARIAFPTVTGLGMTVSKIVAKGLVAFGSMTGTLTLLAMIGGLIGYGVKSFFKFLRTKEKHQLNLTKSLYYQNLDNNAGVLFRLLDDAEEQEFREAMLAYFLLWQRAPADGWTVAELDEKAEDLIAEAIGVAADFEVADAVSKLFNLELVKCQSAGKLNAVPIDQALARLDDRWDDYFRHQPGQSPSTAPIRVRRSKAA